MAYDENVAQRVREIVRARTGISERKMFGGVAFMAHGHMFAGVIGSTLMARIGPAEYESALRQRHVREMNFTGRPMKGYVYVEPDGFDSAQALEYWVNKGLQFTASLPPKPAKK